MIFDELWRAERRARKENERLERLYRPQLDVAEQENKEKYDSLLSEFLELRNLNDAPEVIRSQRLIRRAGTFGIPIPPKPGSADLYTNEDWSFNEMTRNYSLTAKTQLRLTREIRKEQGEHLQHATRWVSQVILPFIGVFGIVTGYMQSRKSFDVAQRVLLVQQTPEVEVGLDPMMSSKNLLIRNLGPEPIVDVKVWWTAYLHPGSQAAVMTLYSKQTMSAGGSTAWWEIPELASGHLQSKSVSDIIQNIGQNSDVTMEMVEQNAAKAAGMSAAPVGWWVRLVFTIQYRRAVDRKRYQVDIAGEVLKDSQTGKYFLVTRAYPIEPDIPTSFPY